MAGNHELNVAEIRSQIEKLNSKSVKDEEAAWENLKSVGVNVTPFLREAYPTFGKWQGRVSLVFHSTRYARLSEDAFQLGIDALNDRATLVRYRACGLLAYSLRKEAIASLKELLVHSDNETVKDARAAIQAIKMQNHHLFMDRTGSGKTSWIVNREADEPVEEPSFFGRLFPRRP